MQKLSLLAVVSCFFIFNACHSTETVKPANLTVDSTNIFPVTSFLRAQLKELDTLPITPLYVVSQNGKKDSTWLKREDMSSLLNHVESFFPFCDTTYNGVIGKVSSSLSCARKKLVTGKMLVLSTVRLAGFTVSVE